MWQEILLGKNNNNNNNNNNNDNKKKNQRRGWNRCPEVGIGEGAQTKYTHVSRCKSSKKKKNQKNHRILSITTVQ
jgi:hypothetical protein